MAKRKRRRQSHGSAWHWKQTDGWYYTLPGAKRRVPLYDDDGQRIKGKERKEAAELALARVKLQGNWKLPEAPATPDVLLVAQVCSEYLAYCKHGVERGQISDGHWQTSKSILNDFCAYCGALPVTQLKKGHVRNWLDSHAGWKSPSSHSNAIAIILAAFNRAEENHGVTNPIKKLKKPRTTPRLYSFTREEEDAIYRATDEAFRDFIFAAIHTGLRPFSELAKLTADAVIEGERGMQWRVFASKTQKTRTIPLLPEVAKLTRKLMVTAPRGSGIPLFRNAAGNGWKKVTGVTRFLGIKRRLGWDKHPARKRYSTYTARHTFAHRMLSGFWTKGVGCSIEVLSELLGNTPKVCFDHYGREWSRHFQEPLWVAVGLGAQHDNKPRRNNQRKPGNGQAVRRNRPR